MTWEKTSNPYIRFFTRKDRPPVTVRRKLFLPRPQWSRYTCVPVSVTPGRSSSASEDCLSLIAEADAPCSAHSKPLTVYLYYHGPPSSLSSAHELVMDVPGGGFICMNPEHHEERLLRWARKTGKVVVSLDYGKVSRRFSSRDPSNFERKASPGVRDRGELTLGVLAQAPEYPFPYAIDEMYDAYSLLHATKGRCIGMNTSGEKELKVVLTGDSA